MVYGLLVVTSVTNSKPTESPTPNSIFWPNLLVHDSSWTKNCLPSFPITSLWNFPWSSSLRSRSSIFRFAFFSLNLCHNKPFLHQILPCISVSFIITANSINSLKAQVILLCLALRRHSVNVYRIKLNWRWRLSFRDAPSIVFFMETFT